MCRCFKNCLFVVVLLIPIFINGKSIINYITLWFVMFHSLIVSSIIVFSFCYLTLCSTLPLVQQYHIMYSFYSIKDFFKIAKPISLITQSKPCSHACTNNKIIKLNTNHLYKPILRRLKKYELFINLYVYFRPQIIYCMFWLPLRLTFNIVSTLKFRIKIE